MTETADQLWVWMTEYPDGTIGTVGAFTPRMGHIQLSARSLEIAEKMRPLAQSHAMQSGQRVWLRRYRMDEDLGPA
jgi:hypothetical protein